MDTLTKRNQMSEKTNKPIKITPTMQRQKKITHKRLKNYNFNVFN